MSSYEQRVLARVKAAIEREMAATPIDSPYFIDWLNALTECVIVQREIKTHGESFLVAMRQAA